MLRRGFAQRIFRLERDPRQLARAFAEASNDRNLAGLSSLLSADLVFIDSEEQRIEGREDFLLAFRHLTALVPDVAIDLKTVTRHGQVALVTGALISRHLAEPVATLWEIEARGECITRIHVYNRGREISMVGILRMAKAQQVTIQPQC